MKNIFHRIKSVRISRKAIFWAIALFSAFIVLLVLATPSLVKYYFLKEVHQVELQKNIRIDVTGFEFKRLSDVSIESVRVIPLKNDTFFSCNHLEVDLDFWKLLFLNPDVQSISVDSVKCNFVKVGDYCNYNFLFKKDKKQSVANHQSNYSERISTILNSLFKVLPSDLVIHTLEVFSNNNGNKTRILSNKLKIVDSHYAFPIQINDSLLEQQWQIEGIVDKSHREISGKVKSVGLEKAILPYLNMVYHTRVAFRSLAFSLHPEKQWRNTLTLTGSASFRDLDVEHARLSTERIQLGDGSLDYSVDIGANYAELDSSSLVTFNRLAFNPYLFIQKDKDWKITASIDKKRFAASDLLSSLPKGLFHNLADVRVKGDLSYHFLLDLDLANPDNLRFESSLKKINFAISSLGELSRINVPFLYTAYDNDRPVRTFEVGLSNPDFCTLDNVSPLLKQAVLQSEDGQFFYHRGFRLEALRKALIYDIKKRRFARGGSTISMQLVKNVFLTRRKNIARKLEEALLVWLIEENKIVSKSRMFEVYLNIAEWGPQIYGIGEASRFYFDKWPSDLTLNEAIFLAGIIPSPKRFANAFDASGNLKSNRAWYFRRIADRLFRTGYISQMEKDSLNPGVALTGTAKRYIFPHSEDSLKAEIPPLGVEINQLPIE